MGFPPPQKSVITPLPFSMRIITTSKFTLPAVSIAAIILWWFGSDDTAYPYGSARISDTTPLSAGDYGLWPYLSVMQGNGIIGQATGLVFSTLAVYLMAELNNSNVLLRVNSRMISSLLAILLTASVFIHIIQPAHIVMLMSVLSYFTLFATYQNSDPRCTFLTYLYLSAASLVFPKLLLTVPFYWASQVHLRSLSTRCFCASLLGTILPYWLYGGYAICAGHTDLFVGHVSGIISFEWGDYAAVSLQRALVAVFSFILFTAGCIDFYMNSYLDKTRTRIIYNVVIILGIAAFLFLALQIQYIDTLLPLAMLPTVIVAGHHIVLSNTRITYIYTIIVGVAALALICMGII